MRARPAEQGEAAAESLAEIGRRAARAAQREALLASLERHGWNLTAASEELRVGSPANVIRSIRTLGLGAEYEAARLARRVSPGNRRSA